MSANAWGRGAEGRVFPWGGGLRLSDICKQTTNFPMEYDKSETCFGIVSLQKNILLTILLKRVDKI